MSYYSTAKMTIETSDMDSLIKIADTTTDGLVLSLNNLSYHPSEDLQGRIISEWKEKGLKEIGNNFCELDGQWFYIGRLLGHANVEGEFVLLPEQKGGILSVVSVKYGDGIRMYAPSQICGPLVLGNSRHVIESINNLNTEIGKVTLYTRDDAGSEWSLHCGNWEH